MIQKQTSADCRTFYTRPLFRVRLCFSYFFQSPKGLLHKIEQWFRQDFTPPPSNFSKCRKSRLGKSIRIILTQLGGKIIQSALFIPELDNAVNKSLMVLISMHNGESYIFEVARITHKHYTHTLLVLWKKLIFVTKKVSIYDVIHIYSFTVLWGCICNSEKSCIRRGVLKIFVPYDIPLFQFKFLSCKFEWLCFH